MLSFKRPLPALRLRDAMTRPPHRLDRFSSSRSECISRLPNPFHYVNKLLARIVHGRTPDPGEDDFLKALSGNAGFLLRRCLFSPVLTSADGLCEKNLEVGSRGVDKPRAAPLQIPHIDTNFGFQDPFPGCRAALQAAIVPASIGRNDEAACTVKFTDPRSAVAVGFSWASRVTGLGLTFVIPPLAGYGFDRVANTQPYGTLIGAALGFVLGIIRLLAFARISQPKRRPPEQRPESPKR